MERKEGNDVILGCVGCTEVTVGTGGSLCILKAEEKHK